MSTVVADVSRTKPVLVRDMSRIPVRGIRLRQHDVTARATEATQLLSKEPAASADVKRGQRSSAAAWLGCDGLRCHVAHDARR
jgi:hypothetical protein